VIDAKLGNTVGEGERLCVVGVEDDVVESTLRAESVGEGDEDSSTEPSRERDRCLEWVWTLLLSAGSLRPGSPEVRRSGYSGSLVLAEEDEDDEPEAAELLNGDGSRGDSIFGSKGRGRVSEGAGDPRCCCSSSSSLTMSILSSEFCIG